MIYHFTLTFILNFYCYFCIRLIFENFALGDFTCEFDQPLRYFEIRDRNGGVLDFLTIDLTIVGNQQHI